MFTKHYVIITLLYVSNLVAADVPLYNNIIPLDDAEVLATQDIAYNHKELYEKHLNVCMAILHRALEKYQFPRVDEDDDYDYYDENGDEFFMVIDQEKMFAYINRRMRAAEDRYLAQHRAPAAGEGRAIVETKCHHVFHRNCIKPWIRDCKETCPLCKKENRIYNLSYVAPAAIADDELCVICQEKLIDKKEDRRYRPY